MSDVKIIDFPYFDDVIKAANIDGQAWVVVDDALAAACLYDNVEQLLLATITEQRRQEGDNTLTTLHALPYIIAERAEMHHDAPEWLDYLTQFHRWVTNDLLYELRAPYPWQPMHESGNEFLDAWWPADGGTIEPRHAVADGTTYVVLDEDDKILEGIWTKGALEAPDITGDTSVVALRPAAGFLADAIESIIDDVFWGADMEAEDDEISVRIAPSAVLHFTVHQTAGLMRAEVLAMIDTETLDGEHVHVIDPTGLHIPLVTPVNWEEQAIVALTKALKALWDAERRHGWESELTCKAPAIARLIPDDDNNNVLDLVTPTGVKFAIVIGAHKDGDLRYYLRENLGGGTWAPVTESRHLPTLVAKAFVASGAPLFPLDDDDEEDDE